MKISLLLIRETLINQKKKLLVCSLGGHNNSFWNGENKTSSIMEIINLIK